MSSLKGKKQIPRAIALGNGKFKYSNIVKLSATGSSDLVISPNPVQDMLVIEGAGQFSQLQIIDAGGRTIRQLSLATSNQFNVSDLKRGVYLLRFANDQEVVMARFIKL